MRDVGNPSGVPADLAGRSGGALRVALDVHMVGERESGNETYVLNLIEGLKQLGAKTSYLLYSPDPAALDVCGTLPRTFAIRRVWPGPSPLRIPLGLPVRVLRDRADVLHVNYIAPPIVSAAVVTTVHDISYVRYPEAFSPRDRWILRTLVPRTMRQAAMVITVSEHARREIASYYGTPEDRIVAIYPSVATLFRPLQPEDVAAVRTRYGLSDPYVLAVGDLQPRKNLARLIRAYAALRARGAYTGRLVLVGKDKFQGSQVSDLVRRLGLQGQVVLTGYVPREDLVGLYGGADVFAYPSLYEGFGSPTVEAMACGCPLVTSSVASLPEVVGDAGLTVDPTDEAALATAIERVVCDGDLRRELIGRGRARVKRYSAQAFAAATQAVYERAAQSRRPGRAARPAASTATASAKMSQSTRSRGAR